MVVGRIKMHEPGARINRSCLDGWTTREFFCQQQQSKASLGGKLENGQIASTVKTRNFIERASFWGIEWIIYLASAFGKSSNQIDINTGGWVLALWWTFVRLKLCFLAKYLKI